MSSMFFKKTSVPAAPLGAVVGLGAAVGATVGAAAGGVVGGTVGAATGAWVAATATVGGGAVFAGAVVGAVVGAGAPQPARTASARMSGMHLAAGRIHALRTLLNIFSLSLNKQLREVNSHCTR